MPVVLKARTTSPGHFFRSSTQRNRTEKHLCESTKLPAVFLQHRLAQHLYVRLDRLRINSGEQRIQFLADGNVGNAVSFEDLRQHATARAVHRVHREFETCFGNQAKIGEPADGFGIRRRQVDFFDRGLLAFGYGPGGDLLFNHLHDGRRGRSAKLRFELYAIPVPRVVTGGDHHPPGGTLGFYRQRNRRGGNGISCKSNGNSRPSNGLSRHPRGVLGEKAGVIADEEAMRGVLMPQNVRSNPARHAAYIVKSKIVGNDAAPAVGAEFDHKQSSVFSR